MKTAIAFTVNSQAWTIEVESHALLADVLREEIGLTGTHVGCDTSQCGACVVHVDGQPVKSCSVFAVQLGGAEIVTVEGLADGDTLSALQAAFHENHALQCGFCTPGMMMTAHDILQRHGTRIDEITVRRELNGNICRCTGYHNIVRAILSAAESLDGAVA